VSFGANGEVAAGERIVKLDPEEASPYKRIRQSASGRRGGSCLTMILFLFDFSGAAAGRGGRGGAVLSPLDFVVVTFEGGPSGWTEEPGVEAP
jgi:hypothetical protein